MENKFLEIIEKSLLEKEKILWSGRPDAKKVYTVDDIFLVPITFVFAIISLVWELHALLMMGNPDGLHEDYASSGLGIVLFLVGIPFVLMGFYISLGRFMLKEQNRKNTIYAITDNRILIIIRQSNGEKIIEEYINKITDVDVSVYKHGNGTIKFGKAHRLSRYYENMAMPAISESRDKLNIFYNIDDVQKVYELVNKLRNDVDLNLETVL